MPTDAARDSASRSSIGARLQSQWMGMAIERAINLLTRSRASVGSETNSNKVIDCRRRLLPGPRPRPRLEVEPRRRELASRAVGDPFHLAS